jgi:hypothetical protein
MLLIELANAMQYRFDPPLVAEAAFWDKDIHITDQPDDTTSTVPCWTSRIEYEAWHRDRWPETLPVS